jgi:hypothetical protein
MLVVYLWIPQKYFQNELTFIELGINILKFVNSLSLSIRPWPWQPWKLLRTESFLFHSLWNREIMYKMNIYKFSMVILEQSIE